jgi:branched-chain amino acid transport system ATP-binding protein
VSYEGIEALKGVSLRVDESEIIALVGSNGVGKTTLLNTISGLISPVGGAIRFEGEDLLTTPADLRARRGLIQVPEGRRPFTRLTVQENLLLGGWGRRKRSQQHLARVEELFPVLGKRRHQLAGTLSGGEQQMLAIGRALMGEPRLLMLDEPSMGLAPLLVRQIFNLIKEIHTDGLTVLLVEQNVRMALSISERAYVLETGSVKLEGSARELAQSDEVRRAYLGEN